MAGFYSEILKEGKVNSGDTIKKITTIQFTFRRSIPDDVDTLVNLSRTTFSETFAEFNTEENMRLYLEKDFTKTVLYEELKKSEFWFLCFHENPVGYIKLDPKSSLDGENALEVERLYVLKKFIGTGGGKILMELAFRRAAEAKAKHLWLAVWENNFPAMEFYSKWGLKVFGQKEFVLGEDVQTDLKMKINLETSTHV